MRVCSLVVEVYDGEGAEQGRYLVRGVDDVLWTDSFEAAVEFVQQQLERLDDVGEADR